MEQREECKSKKKFIAWISGGAVAVIAAVFGILAGTGAFRKNPPVSHDAMYEDEAILKYAVGLPTYEHNTSGTDEEAYWEKEEEYERNLSAYGYENAFKPVSRFGEKLAKEILAKRNGQNSVFSPANIYMALGMLAEVSSGNTREEILKAVESSTIEDMRERYGLLWHYLYREGEEGKCLLGSSLWLRDDMKYKEDAVNRLAKSYYTSTFRGKMGSKPYNEALHQWLNVHTGDLLKDAVSGENFDEQVSFALVTTILYQGMWCDKFAKDATDEGIFHAGSGDIPVAYMHRTEHDGSYYEGKQYSAVTKYLDNGMMLFMLPKEGVSIDDLLSDPDAMNMLTDERSFYDKCEDAVVKLTVPRFDISGSTGLIETLQNLGIQDAFCNSADFSPLMKSKGDYINYANHAARVKTDEDGVEGAAYTIMIASKGMASGREITFTLDRPFLFCVFSRYGVPLFVGAVEQP